jgi:hypothetical protein
MNKNKEDIYENEIPEVPKNYRNFTWSSGSDVILTWRKHGWKPPTEYRNDYLFKINREEK